MSAPPLQIGGHTQVRSALVTGGAGFVGHGVVRALQVRGVAVTVLDPGPPHPLWHRGIAGGGVRHVRGDLLAPRTLAAAAAGVDAVLHLAGVWEGGPGGEDRMRRLNVGGTRAVLALGLPTLCCSSSITCGFGPRSAPGGEDGPSEDPRRPVRGTGRVYRDTKLEIEAMAAAAGAWIVNPDYVVGPGDVGGVVTAGLLAAARLPVFPDPGGGKGFVAVDDCARGHLLALERGEPGRRYLLSAEPRSYADVVGTLRRLSGGRARRVPLPLTLVQAACRIPPLAPTAGALEQMSLQRYRSGARARTELGWQPGPVDPALARMLAWADARAARGRSAPPVRAQIGEPVRAQ
jgi:dihydroflavonol-4-reductase